jgi:thiol-disulfide isomerase/thioredoxin
VVCEGLSGGAADEEASMMRRTGWTGLFAAAVLTCTCRAAFAQDEGEGKAPPQDEKLKQERADREKEAKEKASRAVELLKESAAAMEKVTSLTYTAETLGIGGQGLRVPTMRGSVVAMRGGKKDVLGWKFRVEGKAAPDSHAVLAVYDGSLVRSVRAGEKKVLEASPANAKEALDDGSGAAAGWLIRWKELVGSKFGDSDSAPACRVDGKAEVAGVPCDVVYVDYSDTADPNLFDAWWYLGTDDHLPRRLDLHLVSNAIGDGFVVVKISDLKPGAPVGDGALALNIPDGFEVVKKEPEHEEGIGRAVKVSTIAVGEKAPDWELKDPAGKAHRLSDYAGKVVVMDFWATWCGPCQMAMPGVQAVHEEFKGKPVEVFGMNCWESADPERLMKEKGYTYGLLLNADSVAKDYGVSGIPTFYVIGKDGKVAYSGVGFNPQGEGALAEIVKKELAKPMPQ